MDELINLIVVIIPQYIFTSNHDTVYFKYIHFVNHSLTKLGGKELSSMKSARLTLTFPH